MFKFILVPATGSAADGPVFSTALAVARRSAAHLQFLHVRLDVREVVAAMASADYTGGTRPSSKPSTRWSAIPRNDRIGPSRRCGRSAPRGHRASPTLRPAIRPPRSGAAEIGDEAEWLARYGRAADLVVVGRPPEDEPLGLDLLEAALLDTGRPVLIAPPTAPASLARTIAIAWKDTAETARGVDAARSFLDAAEQVMVLAVEEDGGIDAASTERLGRALRWHNPRTTVRHLKPAGKPPVETLLAAAKTAGADLLVMGGYSHSRLREVVFGGFTRHVLAGADLPVLIAH